MEDDIPIIIPIKLLGEPYAGKTSIIAMYTNKQFISTFQIGFEFHKKEIDINNTKIRLNIWDIVPFEQRFVVPHPSYYKKTKGFILVYDVTNRISFEKIESYWVEQINKNVDFNEFNPPIVLVGNKSDLQDQRKVSIEEGRNLAKKYNYCFYETSAKDNINIDEVFNYLGTEILKKINLSNQQIIIEQEQKIKKDKC